LCRFAVVPLSADRWLLNEGEEGEPPQPTPILDIDASLEVAQNVAVIAEPIATSGGSAVRINVDFDEPSRIDRFFRFRTTLAGVEAYLATDMDAFNAVSGVLKDGEVYRLSWQTITAGGRATVWSDERDTPEFIDIAATANPTAPAALAAAAVVVASDTATVTFTTANDINQGFVAIWRGLTATFADAVKITRIVAQANVTLDTQETSLADATYYYWAVPENGSGVSGPETGPLIAIIS
jgi:hypothetical protein